MVEHIIRLNMLLIACIFAKKASVYSKKIQVTSKIFQGIK